MANPKLQIELRLDRIESAIRRLSFEALEVKDAEKINDILRGTDGEDSTNASE